MRIIRNVEPKARDFYTISTSPSNSSDMRSQAHQLHHQVSGSPWVRGASWEPSGLGASSRISSLLSLPSPAVEYTRRVGSLDLRAYRPWLPSPERHRYHWWHCARKKAAPSRISEDDRYRWSHRDQSRSARAYLQNRLPPWSIWPHTRVSSPAFLLFRGQRIMWSRFMDLFRGLSWDDYMEK